MAQLQTVDTKPAKAPEPPRLEPRRFQLPDLDSQGGWLIERMTRALFKSSGEDLPRDPITTKNIAAFLKGCIYGNEFLFLYQDDAVGLFQMDPSGALGAKTMIRERFVFVRDHENKEHVAQGLDMYDRALKWAKHMGASAIIVEEMSDVPHDMIRERIGRLFTKQMVFARV